MFISAVHVSSSLQSSSLLSTGSDAARKSYSSYVLYANSLFQMPARTNCSMRRMACFANSEKSSVESEIKPKQSRKSTSAEKTLKTRVPKINDENSDRHFPPMIPKKPRRGRKSEAAAVEDFVRDSLGRTFDSIRQQNPDIVKDIENIMKQKASESNDSEDSSDDEDDSDDEKEMLVEEEDPNWPLDADVGWGIRASEYFEQHPIRNVLGEDGNVIDWEGEIDNGLVKEINCLEWERFAFHPSPLIVLVFERYNRSSDNWKVLKELEKAAMVYWEAKDRLPPRTVKIDMNIERDLAYALKVKECPQILFLRGNKMLYREKDIRSADELVQMIAFFYYNARKPSCINEAALTK